MTRKLGVLAALWGAVGCSQNLDLDPPEADGGRVDAARGPTDGGLTDGRLPDAAAVDFRVDGGRDDAALPGCEDGDGDGRGDGCPAGPDCDDGDPRVYDGAEERCDGVDNDCDGQADERWHALGDRCEVGLGACASLEDEELFVGPTLGVTLPLFERNQGPREQAEAQVSIAAAQRDVLSARVESEQQTARRRVTEAEGLREQLVADPLEEARATLRAVEAGYLAGQLDLPDTVLLQREVLDGEAACLALLRQIAAARLDLMLATEDPALLGGAR